MSFCNVIIYSYHYLLDPKIAERVSKELSKDCIVVFDEAHNIDNVCIESLSTDITEDSLRKATRGAQNLERKISEMKDTDAEKLQNEYAKLVEGLRDADQAREEDAFMSNPGAINLDISSYDLSLTPICSFTRRPPQRSCTREHKKSRTFCGFFKEVCGVSKGISSRSHQIRLTNSNLDSHESSTSYLRVTGILSTTSERYHVH
jgi:Rad3-related DNA helicase